MSHPWLSLSLQFTPNVESPIPCSRTTRHPPLPAAPPCCCFTREGGLCTLLAVCCTSALLHFACARAKVGEACWLEACWPTALGHRYTLAGVCRAGSRAAQTRQQRAFSRKASAGQAVRCSAASLHGGGGGRTVERQSGQRGGRPLPPGICTSDKLAACPAACHPPTPSCPLSGPPIYTPYHTSSHPPSH